MSTKTLRKRIAVVAASALTAGFLSVTSMPAANASDAVFVIGDTTAIGTIVAPAGLTTSQTATISSSGRITVKTVAGASGDVSGGRITVSGGTIISAVDGTNATPVAGYASSPTSFTYGTTVAFITFQPDAGVNSMTITSYASATNFAAGTKAAEMIVLIKSAAASGVVDAGNSFAAIQAASETADPTTDVDVAAHTSVKNPTNGRIGFDLYDGNNVAMPTNTVVTTTATGGCLVGATNAATSFLSTSVTSAYNASSLDEVFIARSVANAPFSCTLTLTANGIVFATKSIKLEGKVVKVEATDLVTAKKNGTSAAAFGFEAYDAAGNKVDAVSVSTVDTSTAAFASSSAGNTDETNGATGSIVCNDTEGTGTFKLRVTNASNDLIDSPTYTVTCAGTAVNYSASLDKASYVPGDIATLTISATSSGKIPVNDYTFLGGLAADGTGATFPVGIAGSNMTAITAPTSTDKFSAGKKTYKFIVGATAGSYQLSVDLPKFNGTTYSQSAVTVPYKIASSGGVTNEEVLKSIVALIASINKQIQALQKLILKR